MRNPVSLAILVVCLVVIALSVVGCKPEGARCVRKATGVVYEDRMCEVGNPAFEWRKVH